jgi:hypothetical protein
MKPIIPREHGGWAMVSVPFFLGMFVGGPKGIHLPLFVSWMLFYLATYPFRLALVRRKDRREFIRWALIYWALGMVFLLPPLVAEPSLLWVGPVLVALLCVNGWYAYRRDERSFVNDLCAIFAFSVGGAAAYVVGAGKWDAVAWEIALLCILYFLGSVFFVKSVFRERKNSRWLNASKGYHLLLIIVLVLLEPWFVLAYLYSAIRAFVWGGKTLRPMKVGIIEIIGSLLFLVLSIVAFTVRPSMI